MFPSTPPQPHNPSPNPVPRIPVRGYINRLHRGEGSHLMQRSSLCIRVTRWLTLPRPHVSLKSPSCCQPSPGVPSPLRKTRSCQRCPGGPGRIQPGQRPGFLRPHVPACPPRSAVSHPLRKVAPGRAPPGISRGYPRPCVLPGGASSPKNLPATRRAGPCVWPGQRASPRRGLGVGWGGGARALPPL